MEERGKADSAARRVAVARDAGSPQFCSRGKKKVLYELEGGREPPKGVASGIEGRCAEG